VSKRDYTLKAIHCMYSRSRKRREVESKFLSGGGGGGRKKSRSTGRAWSDMYEAASQAGGGRVQGQARQRQQTPVLEEERGEMRNAREDGMDRRPARPVAAWICYRQRVWS
jgi:hypothetical protein